MGDTLDAHGGVGGGHAGVARGVVADAVDLGVSERTAGYVLLRLRGAMARSESVQAA